MGRPRCRQDTSAWAQAHASETWGYSDIEEASMAGSADHNVCHPRSHLWYSLLILVSAEQTWIFPDTSLLFTQADLTCRCEEFLLFFKELREVSAVALPYDPALGEYEQSKTCRASSKTFCAIEPHSLLHRVMVLPPIHQPGGSSPHSSQAYTQLATLFYLAATILDLRDAPSEANLFLKEVQQRVLDVGLVRGFSADALFWTMTIDHSRSDWRFGTRSRLWQVARLMSVTKSLLPHTQENMKIALIRFLVPGADEDAQDVLFNPLQASDVEAFVEECLIREMWASCWLSSVHSR